MATVDEPRIWKRASLLVIATLDWCDVTRTNIMRLFHCLWSPIVSVYYEYQVWQGSDCVPGTCVPSKNKHRGRFDLLDDFQYSCCSGGLWEGWWWKGWQLEPSLLRLWSFIFLSGGQMNLKKPLLSIKYTDETALHGPELFVRGHFWPIDCSCNVYPFTHSISTSHKTVSSFFFNCWKPETALIKKDGAVFVIFSHRVHLPSLNEISLLWYCLLMEQFVWGWHFFAATGFMEPTISPASGCLLGCFFSYPKPLHFARSPSMDSQPSQKSNHRLSSVCERELGEIQHSFFLII